MIFCQRYFNREGEDHLLQLKRDQISIVTDDVSDKLNLNLFSITEVHNTIDRLHEYVVKLYSTTFSEHYE